MPDDATGLIEARLIETVKPDLSVRSEPLSDNASILASQEVDASEILVQVLRRPSDPICKRLQDCLYEWIVAGIPHMPLEDAFGGWIDVARNWQTLLFRKDKRFKYLMLVDSDVGPPIEAPILLGRHHKPLVSGIVPAYNGKRGLFLCIAVNGADGKAKFVSIGKNSSPNCIPARGLVPIHNSGAGCLMIRRDVIEALWDKFEMERALSATARQVDVEAIQSALTGTPLTLGPELIEALRWRIRKANFEHDMTGGPFSIPDSVRARGAEIGIMPKGEDVCFTDRVRELGFEMFADFEVRCSHEKLMTLLWPKDAIDPHLTVEDFATMTWEMDVEQGI